MTQYKYLVSWKGYPISEVTWEPEDHLKSLLDLVYAFHTKCHGQGSSTVMESEHNTIIRKELEEDKNTRNDIVQRLEVQER